MDAGYSTPFLDLIKTGQVDRDTKLIAAQGTLGLRVDEHRAVLELLAGDADPDIARTAAASLTSGVLDQAVGGVAAESQGESETSGQAGEETAERAQGLLDKLAAMNPAQRMSRAMKGTREERTILIRDPNKIVAVAVLSSPKLSEAEVEAIAKMTNVSDEILRIVGNTRAWMKSYRIMSALTRNPKTPQALALNLLSRLQEKDVKMIVTDRNIPDAVRTAARRRLSIKG
ncbi:MAG: hypothetical protein HOP16_19715 [Acidobacteria bacterium]|nr:hypothetical protein [Acidobacteriota bacterium]